MDYRKIGFESLLASRLAYTRLSDKDKERVRAHVDKPWEADTTTIIADYKTQGVIIDYFKGIGSDFVVFAEEPFDGVRVHQLGDVPQFYVTIDSVDGTINLAYNRDLPRETAVAVGPYKEGLKIGDFTFGGSIELRNGRVVYAVPNEGCIMLENTRKINLKVLDKEDKRTFIAYDFYFPENLEAALRLKDDYPRTVDASCTCEHYVMVSDGLQNVAAFVNLSGKTPEELVPGYRQVVEAGGVVINPLTGTDIGDESFEPERRYPVIAAYRKDFAHYIMERCSDVIERVRVSLIES